ncbi:MAG: ABC transporter substrate-binding protein [Actinomycetota bacterium]
MRHVRRGIIATLALALALSAAACGGEKKEAAGKKVEVFSWWTAGGEADGLAAMVKVFNNKYPDFTFDNAAVAGGAGTNARAVLATRLSAGNPPASWQGHAGQELIGTYVAAGQIQPLNDLFKDQGWLDVMPQSLIDLISKDGKIYSVPVNIHRANVLWYNPSVLSKNGVTAPKTWAEFFTAAAKLKAAGVTPLAMGEQWTSMHLFETVLLGSAGADKYNGLWSGSTSWTGAEVKQAIATFAQVLGYTNKDASTLSWDQAAQLVVNGNAAFTIMGDWAEGFFKQKNLKPNTGFGWAASPGTDGVFDMLSDSFVWPKSSPNPDGTKAWLIVAGSKEGQDAFNPVKGSIPARKDADRSLYDEYLQWSMDQWKADKIVGSLAHGAAANDNWKSQINTALGLFLANQLNQAGFQAALSAACKAAGPCT